MSKTEEYKQAFREGRVYQLKQDLEQFPVTSSTKNKRTEAKKWRDRLR